MRRLCWTSSLAAFALLAASPLPGRCQASLSVNVTGIASALPDLMFLYVRAVARDTDVGAAQKAHDETLKKVREAMVATGLKESEINPSGFAIDPITTNYGGSRDYRIVGYEVSTVLTVMLPLDAAKPDAARERALNILAAAAAAGGEPGVPARGGGERRDCIRYGVSDPAPYQDQALDRALAEIRPKAERMAKQLGLTLMAIQNVNCSFETRQRDNYVSVSALRALMSPGGYDWGSTGPEPIEFRAQVNAAYLVE
jgi:uncharacterized protein YggE